MCAVRRAGIVGFRLQIEGPDWRGLIADDAGGFKVENPHFAIVGGEKIRQLGVPQI